MEDPTDPQHHRPEYLAGQNAAIVIAIGLWARSVSDDVRRAFDGELGNMERQAEAELEGRKHFVDYHTGYLHAVARMRREV